MPQMLRRFRPIGFSCFVATVFAASPVLADVMTFGAAKDATLYESLTGSLSGGGEDGFFAGLTIQGASDNQRRGLIAFDLSTMPSGATINSVSLRLNVVRARESTPQAMTLHGLVGNWGEGTMIDPDRPQGGSGGPSANGDATWIHQFRPGDLWDAPGGDFVGTASASANVPGFGAVTWSSSGLVADVQAWIDNPATNFGWLLKDNETINGTARKFASREFAAANSRPLLTVDFTLPPARTPGDVNNDGTVNAADVALLAASFGSTTTANNFDVGEFSGDGLVGVADLAIVQQNITALGMAPSAAAVPEPSAWALCLATLTAAYSFRGFGKLRARACESA